MLFLHQHPTFTATGEELAERLYLGDRSLVEKMVADLRMVGLIDCVDDSCTWREEQTTELCLWNLATIFEHPLARQKILDQVRRR